MFRDAPAPTRSRLSSVSLRRTFDGEDWRAYNRLSLWIKPVVRGLPVLPLQIVLHNDGAEKVPDKHYREGIHYVTLADNQWTQVVWEIEPLALGPRHGDRDRLLGEQDARGAGRHGCVRDRAHRAVAGHAEPLLFPRPATGALAFTAARECFFGQPCG